jgi:hypothetical protein
MKSRQYPHRAYWPGRFPSGPGRHRLALDKFPFAKTGFGVSLIIERPFQNDLPVFKMLNPRELPFKGPFPKKLK